MEMNIFSLLPDQPASMKKLAKGGQATAFYVFNNPEQPGWVIIAGDDRARPILAYGDEDYFVAEDVPECVQDWLNGYDHLMAVKNTPLYNIRAIPSVYLLDKEKRVILKDVPTDYLMQYLQMLFGL